MKKQHYSSFAGACLLWISLATLPSLALGQTANEQGIWNLWQLHIKDPEAHIQALEACQNFVKANPADPFTPVAQTIAAWHLLKLGRVEEARSSLTQWLQPSQDPLRAGARELARAWLTRLDMEAVHASLQEYYLKQVRYPETLSAIAAHPRIEPTLRPPPSDRWGRAWTYRLEGFKALSGFLGQRYFLESPSLKSMSDLQTALDVPYATLISVQPIKTLRNAAGTPMIQARALDAANTNAEAIVQQGNFSDNLFFAHIGDRIMLVCDRLHWRVIPLPRR